MPDYQDSGWPTEAGLPPVDPPSSPRDVEDKTEGTAAGDTATGKPSHLLEEDYSTDSHTSKRRRTESNYEELPANSQQDATSDQIPGSLIEQDLASALGIGAANSAQAGEDGRSKAEGSADVATVLSSIMNHAERIEERCSLSQQQMAENTDQPTPEDIMILKANSHLRMQSLPILDNLSTQILSLLAKSSFKDITSIASEPHSEHGQAYATMRSLFDHTKKVYSTKSSFLSASELGLQDSAQIDIIRKANLASFVSSIFGTQEIGFAELNDNFLDIFVPEGGRLLKVQGALFLELKTQAFIASMNSMEHTRTELLYSLFPESLEQEMLSRRPGTRQLAPSEIDFVSRARSRRDILLADINNEEVMKSLPDKYYWEDFLRDLSSYITKNFESISHIQGKKIVKGRPQPSSNGDTQDSPGVPLQSQFSVAQPAADVPVDKNMHGDLVARAARAAQIALQGHGLRRSQQQQRQPKPLPQQDGTSQGLEDVHGYVIGQQTAQRMTRQQQPQQYRPTSLVQGYQQQPGQYTFQQASLQPSFQQYNPAPPPSSLLRTDSVAVANHGYMPGIPHYSQSQPTQVLYERARMAASVKSSPSSRKTGLPSQRRPWTTEEENALMAGLDRVKGPHWSQILAMFGPGGTISEALKDRNQVQLKDKARNLKLFFLKSGIEVPYYLKFVTGELKTRAPAQAAKREARERQKKQGEEDKAHVEGIKGMMALAGAHSQSTPMTPGTDSLSASPSLPSDTGSQATYDQVAEQNLMQTLGQEIRGEQFEQGQHQGEGLSMGQ